MIWPQGYRHLARRNLDLLLVVAVFFASMAALLWPDLFPDVVDAAAAMLVAIVLPGYAAGLAIYPFVVRGSVRAAFSLGLGLVVTVAVALILSAYPMGIGRTQWLAAFATTTAIAVLLAAIQRRGLVSRPRRLPRIDRPSLQTAGMFAVASLIVVLAVTMRVVAGPDNESTFTQLWVLPSSTAAPGTVELGVANHEAGPAAYRLDVIVGEETRPPINIRLDPGDEWTLSVEVAAAGQTGIEAILYRLPDTSEPYRHVSLLVEGAS